MGDLVDRRTRGLLAIAITDRIHALGLRPVSPILVGLRQFFRLEVPVSTGDLLDQALAARRTAGVIGCVGLFGLLLLPVLLPLEIIRGLRVRAHNRRMRDRLQPALPAPGGYRDSAKSSGGIHAELDGADQLFAIDWTIWRDGGICFAGSALGVIRGQEQLAPWLMLYRALPPKDARAAAALKAALPDLPLTGVRWEWEIADPFEAVERE